MAVVYVSDPFVYYHKEGIYPRTFVKNFNMRIQMPGLIKHLEYETLFVGTSMVHNFKEETINEKLKTTSLNASISGSSAAEQRKVVELATASKDIERIYWEINYDSLAGEPDRMDASFPEYLYDRNIINDLPYLLSYDSFKRIDYQIENQDSVNMKSNPYSFYKFGDKKDPLTIEQMKKETEGLSAPMVQSHTLEVYLESFRENILNTVKKNPDIQFTFFYSPYPITRHMVIQEHAPEINRARLEAKLEIFKELEKMKNVAVYDFQDQKEITFNVANYMDRSHFFSYINDWMLAEMSKNQPIRTEQEYRNLVRNLIDQLENFSYVQLEERKN